MDSSTSGLQFDTAEPAASGTGPDSGAVCTACSTKIVDTYFESNGKVVCPSCKAQIEQSFQGGSRAGRAFKAALFGTGVAALGSLVWYGIRVATEASWGIVSILIGVGVGMAVRKGSGGRGGWFYQAMAMYLTYSAVVVTYVPDVLKGLKEVHEEREKTAAAAPAVPGPETPKADPADPAAGPAPTPVAAEAPAPSGDAAEANAKVGDGEELSTGMLLAGGLLFMLFVLAVAYAAPFLAGFENILGLCIIAFGLYEAWKLNKKAQLVFNGPLRVAAAAPPTTPPAPEPGSPTNG
ncbi:MAG: hypothetical protein QM765_33210 [Myxococcales bacterium]